MQDLLLLHGAIGASSQLDPLSVKLSGKYRVHSLNFSGHGGRPFPDEAFSIKLFAGDVLQWMDENDMTSIPVFGYSMGGYVAMYLARHYPERVSGVITLATKFHWNKIIADKETKMLVPEKIIEKLPGFARALEERHAPNDWKEVLNKTAKMLIAMGQNNTLSMEDYPLIVKPVLLLSGDRDAMITLEETLEVYHSLLNAQMAMLPKTPHPIEQVNLDALVFLVDQFFKIH